ncbi:MAG: hypothetical protein LCH61_02210 [Proteobacteria bacterium]|nr:hypothetical protein [Pseudomonadota bacterium]
MNHHSAPRAGQALLFGLILLLGVLYAIHGLWTLYQGEYWVSSRTAPPVLETGTRAFWLSLSQLTTGAGIAAVATTLRSTTPRLWWGWAVVSGVATLAAYGVALSL